MKRVFRAKQLSMFPGVKPEPESRANRGMEFEHELMVMHQLYKMRGLAVIEKNHCPSQPIKDGRLARVTGKAIVDFSGLTADGRFVAFDAKDCAGTSISLDRLLPHQVEYLGSVHALGGKAFVLVRFERKHCFAVPIDAWSDADQAHHYKTKLHRADGWQPKNTASLCMADMKPEWAVRGVDWLGGIEK